MEYLENVKVESTKELKYFSSLKVLSINTQERNVDHLKNLKGLQKIDIAFAEDVESIDFVEDLEYLTSFEIMGSVKDDGTYCTIYCMRYATYRI